MKSFKHLWTPPLACFFYWCLILFIDFDFRAFDTADPLMHLVNAQPAIEAWQSGGFFAWLQAVAQETTARPLLTVLMSLGPILRLSGGLSHHYAVTGLCAAVSFAAAAALAVRCFGIRAGWIFFLLSAFSNLNLEHALAGGHNWLGQALFWPGLFLLSRSQDKKFCAPAAGCLFSLAVLASYHILPMAGLACAFWIFHRFRSGEKSPALKDAAWLALGAVLPLIPIVAASAGSPYFYLKLLFSNENLYWAKTRAAQFPSGPGFFPKMLWMGESAPYLALTVFTAAWGARRIWPAVKMGGNAALLIFGIPIIFLAFLELSGMVRLGRMYAPLLPFFAVWAAIGFDSFLTDQAKWKNAAWITLVLVLGINGWRQIPTWKAFHAGKIILESAQKENVPLVAAAGFHLPFSYFPSDEPRSGLPASKLTRDAQGRPQYVPNFEQRPLLRSDVKKLIRTGEEWILVSFYSTWNWHYFIEDQDPEVFPARTLYSSVPPYREFPGVEMTDYLPFTNEGLYYFFNKGRVPFPAPNRIYKGRDVLNFLETAP